MKRINIKHAFVAIAAILVAIGLAAYAIFGGRTRRDIIGVWVISSDGTDRGFHCGNGGIAASINNDTIQYNCWELHGKQLVLKGKKFSNRKVSDFADTLHIRKINASSLTVMRDEVQLTYHKIR